ncbi:MAG: peptidoglycan DD-metalloendopeptidase family protein [Rhodospirillales bacterium]
MNARIALALAAVLALSGCGYRDTPAPVVTPAAPAPQPVASAPAAAESRFHVVRRGDTLSELAQRYGVGMSTLAQANGLRPPYRIMAGQQLRLPGGAPASAIAARPPDRAVERAPEPATAMAAPRPPAAVAAAPLPPPSPARPQVSPAAVPSAPEPAAARPAPPPADGRERATVVATLPPLQEASPVAAPPVAAPPVAALAPAAAPAAAVARPAPEPQPPAAVQPSQPAGAGGRFLWPLEGKVVVGYGPQPGGLHNDGINISADRGTPVRAADDGMVAYAGNELGGFGNLLLIKHADGWLTAYAHNEEILVKIGDTVRRGQMVARVGSSGSANAPQLHFEIRRGERPVDPVPLLAGSATVRSTVAPAGRRDPG